MYLNEYQRTLQVQNSISIQENLEPENITDSFSACAVIICEENFCGDFGASGGNSVEKATEKKIRDSSLHSCWHSFHHFHRC